MTHPTVSVGASVGGAIACGGRPHRGPHGTAEEIANLLASETGPIHCGCGVRDQVPSTTHSALFTGVSLEDFGATRTA